ncbi:MAG: DUF5069 domain-containing protein [Verrucomicrobiae bacterium]|nr:DUF5069 domain-containing protein [Verrucomicrobiae bacterium]MCB1091750.1 DUF5069 domain-containing protein [Verrucomicrobiae bacterium]
MSNYAWDSQFTELFDRCLTRYRGGDTDYSSYYTDADLSFLASIGYKPRELFDFVEDHGDGGEPSIATAVMVASVRRDYLRTVMKGQLSDHEVTPDQLPPKDSELEGVRWLPRILVKARAKLRGELNPEIMYGCGGDRRFLREHDIAPADFLRAVWASNGDDSKVLAYVLRQG